MQEQLENIFFSCCNNCIILISYFLFSGKAHLREALLLHEEAMGVNRMCRELRKKDVLQDVLRLAHDRSLNKYASIDEEDDFQVSYLLG